jgi:glycosyltransferase 2 family protein
MTQPADQRVAVFDVDGTLLRGDCLLLAVRRSSGIMDQLLGALTLLPWMIGWKLHLLSTSRFKQATIAVFGLCEVVNRAEAEGREEWLLRELLTQLRPEALQRLRWHQERGDRVLLCSASPRMLLQPLADWLGVQLLCTELEGEQGEWQPKLTGPNCKGPEKVRSLVRYLGQVEGLTIEAYGDSKGDRELLQLATLPHYRSFTPHPVPYPPFSFGSLLPLLALVLLAYGLLGSWSQADQLLPLLPSLWPQIGLGLLLVLLGYGIRYCRWRLLLRAVNQRTAFGAGARIWMGSYAFTATPGKSAEVMRSLLLRQECGVPVPPSLMALVVERLTDVTAVLLLLLVHLPLLLTWQMWLAAPIGFGLSTLIVGWLLLNNHWTKARFMRSVKRLLPHKLARAADDGLVPLRQLLKPAVLLQATTIGALAWSLEGMSLWVLLRGMGIEMVSISGATIVQTSAGLLGALTLLPGGLVTTEAGSVGLLFLQGVSLAAATLATLLIRLMTLWFATALGVACLLWSRQRSL